MRTNSHSLSLDEKAIIKQITDHTMINNKDNISRTNSYFSFFRRYPQIRWSFLASVVSRNAGWNMCDLESKLFKKVLSPKIRWQLFLTYEKANWLIFQDAFPQLLLYDYSTKYMQPMFHLLRYFHVSQFMEKEWYYFWEKGDEERLLTSLIINEQNLIQRPVIEHPVYKKKVFTSLRFMFQQLFHFNMVILPTIEGKLFGASVTNFREVSSRIDLGKRLANILFQPALYKKFFRFSIITPHTGSRDDYEQYLHLLSKRETPSLRTTFPIVPHHLKRHPSWRATNNAMNHWLKQPAFHHHPIELTSWYHKKQTQLNILLTIGDFLLP